MVLQLLLTAWTSLRHPLVLTQKQPNQTRTIFYSISEKVSTESFFGHFIILGGF